MLQSSYDNDKNGCEVVGGPKTKSDKAKHFTASLRRPALTSSVIQDNNQVSTQFLVAVTSDSSTVKGLPLVKELPMSRWST